MAANADALFDEIVDEAPQANAGAADSDDEPIAGTAGAAAAAAASAPAVAAEDADDHNPERCGRCLQIVEGPFITAVSRKWHPEHFTCMHCDQVRLASCRMPRLRAERAARFARAVSLVVVFFCKGSRVRGDLLLVLFSLLLLVLHGHARFPC